MTDWRLESTWRRKMTGGGLS